MKDIVSTADQVETKFDAAFHAMDLDGDGKISQSVSHMPYRIFLDYDYLKLAPPVVFFSFLSLQ